MEQHPMGEVPWPNWTQFRQHTAPREIQRGGVLDHQDGPLLQALPGRVPGETLLQGGRLHTRVGQEAIDPLGLSPAACGLRDGIARPLRERFQYGGQAGRKAFVRQNCSRRHPRRPECVRVHRASLTRYQSLLSATPFLLSTICLMGRSHQLTEVMGNAQMSKWGLTPQIPSDIEESGHGKDGPNAYRLQPYPYGLSGRNARFSRRDIPISWGFFWVLSLRKNRSPSFFGSVANFHLSRFRV